MVVCKIGVECPFVIFRRVFSIEKAKIFTLLSRADNYKMDLNSSKDINAADVSDTSLLRPIRFHRSIESKKMI